MNRRNFLELIGAAGATVVNGQGARARIGISAEPGYTPGAAVVSAMREFGAAMAPAGPAFESADAQFNILIRRPNPAAGAENFAIAPYFQPRPGIAVSGGDERGLVYGLLELADQARGAADPLRALSPRATGKPYLKVRSIARLFTSDVEDKPWFNDREMWPRYFAMLAGHRFNRFNLSFGIGYDFLQNVTDAYFLFTYPFLLDVPGYKVRARALPDAERDSNLAMLKFIGEQAIAHGLDFQLGLWMHGYKWLNSPNPNYTIEGLNAENHGPYCRDALRMLLNECTAISGVTFRIHGESGVQEGSFDFWKTVFDGAAACGRRIEIDMHAKGMNQGMIDIALSTGLPVKISPKYWAEHMGMPYEQADIRVQERPRPGKNAGALMKYSAGSRSFLRYGYGDLLREDRKYSVMTRVWPGTQRLLLWGDPETAALHARAFGFCGEDGVEICEPLSFKGRRGSGRAGDRCGYKDASLRTRWDWQKYEYTYRVWGRLLYDPKADPEQWRRALRRDFGAGAQPGVEAALGNASRILPIVTTAYCPSAANNNYWPEMYLNQPIVAEDPKSPYTDTSAPKVFGNASPLDPQLFASMWEYADALLAGGQDGRYSPAEVAASLHELADRALQCLGDATARAKDKHAPAFRRMAVDTYIQAELGRFFGAKLRAGIFYRVYERTHDDRALEQAVSQYGLAREAWARLAEKARGVYVPDITVGEHPQLHGHWLDRLPAIDRDIAAMAAQRHERGARDERVPELIHTVLNARWRDSPRLAPAARRITRGKALSVELDGRASDSVRLYYRRVDHAERWVNTAMENRAGRFTASIPAEYTDSPFPIQYYFETVRNGDPPVLFPGLSSGLGGQPYIIASHA